MLIFNIEKDTDLIVIDDYPNDKIEDLFNLSLNPDFVINHKFKKAFTMKLPRVIVVLNDSLKISEILPGASYSRRFKFVSMI